MKEIGEETTTSENFELVRSNFEFVKVKIRAMGKENKRHQRTMPIGCS